MQKKAFSLTEVLLVMGIIAVVTAMGFSISKKGMENAYNMYWYTGYSALADATNDAIDKNRFAPTAPSLQAYANYIGNTLMRAEVNYADDYSKASFTASNGTRFDIEPKTTENNNTYYQITMTIPKPQTRKVVPFKTIFIFDIDKRVVYPANVTTDNLPSGENIENYISLQTRVDLLPFYIKTSEIRPISTFYNYRNAYCITHDNLSYTDLDGIANIVCSSSSGDPEPGIPISISPKRAF